MSDLTPPPPDGRKTIDLDAARRARAEQRRRDGKSTDNLAVRFLGADYPLPPELPAETVHAFGALIQGDYSGLGLGMEKLFGGAWEKIKEAGDKLGEPLSFDDEVFLLEQAFECYGMPLPESPASAPS